MTTSHARKNQGPLRKKRCPLTASPRKRNAANKLAASVKADLPLGLAQPALRALASAGISRLDQFTEITETDLLKLHGVGPKAIGIIRSVLDERGLSFMPPNQAALQNLIPAAVAPNSAGGKKK